MFDALIDRLGANFTVFAYDQRDCGHTENPPVSYTLADLGDDAAGFIAALGLPRAHIYGSSLGGLVAQSLAARHPDRVDRLVLGNTWRVGVNPAERQSGRHEAAVGLSRRSGRQCAEDRRIVLSTGVRPGSSGDYRDVPRQRAQRGEACAPPPR